MNVTTRFRSSNKDFVTVCTTTNLGKIVGDVVNIGERDVDLFNKFVALDNFFGDLEHGLLDTKRVVVGKDVQEVTADGVVSFIVRSVPRLVPFPLAVNSGAEEAVLGVTEGTVFVLVEVSPFGARSAEDREANDASNNLGTIGELAGDGGVDIAAFGATVNPGGGVAVLALRDTVVQVLSEFNVGLGDMRVLAEEMTAEVNSEGFRFVTSVVGSDGVAGVLDGVGGDDLAVVTVGVGSGEFTVESNADGELHNFVEMGTTLNLGDTDLVLAVRVGSHNRSVHCLCFFLKIKFFFLKKKITGS